MSGQVKERAHERIRHLSRAGLDVAGFLDEASEAILRAVPGGTDHSAKPYWYTLDPESQLITSDYGGDGCQLDTNAVMRWEYIDDDVNKYSDVLRHARGVQTLHQVTRGEPERSRIYREYMVEAGLAQEMLVALRTRSGESWGTLRLNRAPRQPEFDATELDFMAAVAPHLADGVRRGLLVGEATAPDLPDAPGLVLLSDQGEVESYSPRAQEWLARLPGPQIGRGLPASVASVAWTAFDGESAEPTARLRGVDGRWISVHGSIVNSDARPKVAIIIEPARRERIAPLLMAIYGLSPRERDVTRHVLRGCSTAEVARGLRMSPNTVQQHLKRIFDKSGVRSRRELVASFFFDSFEPRVADNGQRTRVKQPIRGGPLRATAETHRPPATSDQGAPDRDTHPTPAGDA